MGSSRWTVCSTNSFCLNTRTRVMPESDDSAPTARTSVLPGPILVAAKALPAAYPLDDFYARARLPLPDIQTINAAELPEPYRSLLAHSNDMTPTLSAFHARVIHLR